MERRGSGIKKILKEYEEENHPEFYSDQQCFIVTSKNKNYQQATQQAEAKYQDRIAFCKIPKQGTKCRNLWISKIESISEHIF